MLSYTVLCQRAPLAIPLAWSFHTLRTGCAGYRRLAYLANGFPLVTRFQRNQLFFTQSNRAGVQQGVLSW